MDPTTDFGFKKLFGEEATSSFNIAVHATSALLAANLWLGAVFQKFCRYGSNAISTNFFSKSGKDIGGALDEIPTLNKISTWL